MNINSMHALCFTLWKLVGSSHASQDLKFHMMGFGVNLCGLSQSGYSGPSVLRIFSTHFIDGFLASFFSNVFLELLLNISIGPPGLVLKFCYLCYSIFHLFVVLTTLWEISSNLTFFF